MKIALVRHGLTKGNLKKAYIGVTDESLCASGVSALMASSVGEKVRGFLPHCTQVYVSGRKRTQETASLLFPEMEQVVCSFLDEMDFGIFEGKNYEDLSSCPDYRAWVEGGCVSPCPEGEGLDSFLPRVKQGFLSVVDRPVDEIVARPVDEIMAQPVDEIMAQPVDEIMARPVDEIVAQLVDNFVDNHVDKFVDNVEKQALEQSEEGKIFVVHGGTIMGICSQFVKDSTYYQWQVSCGEVLFFHWEEGTLQIC